MKIQRNEPRDKIARPVRSGKPAASATAGGFVDKIRNAQGNDSVGAADAAHESGVVRGAGAVDSLLAIQEVDDATEGKGRRPLPPTDWGDAVLDRLDDIRMALLSGGISPLRLDALIESLARDRNATDDAGLARLLGEIETRARVEAAKRGR